MNAADAQNRPAVVVTGVSSGIGLAIAEDLLERGYQVFGSVRRASDAEQLTKCWGHAFEPLLFDVTDTAALPRIVAQVEKALWGRGLKALVNNAGIGLNGPLMHQPMAEIRQMFEVNFFSILEVTRAFLPLLGARQGAGHPRGRVVNISSVSGRVTAPFMGAYSASKHAVEALTQALRRELSLYGIQASSIQPGFIRSRIFEKEMATKPMERYTDTDFGPWWLQFLRSATVAASRAKSADIVTRAVRDAIEARKPRTRYPLDVLCFMGRWFSDRTFDRVIFKALGLDKTVV